MLRDVLRYLWLKFFWIHVLRFRMERARKKQLLARKNLEEFEASQGIVSQVVLGPLFMKDMDNIVLKRWE